MNLATLIVTLMSTQWTTPCVMTQADGLQGFTRDSAVFKKSENLSPGLNNTVNVTLTRTWFEDDQCSTVKSDGRPRTGIVTLGKLIQTMSFPSDHVELTYEADFKFADQKNDRVELGALAITTDKKSIRMTTQSFGSNRNTMLSLFRYIAN